MPWTTGQSPRQLRPREGNDLNGSESNSWWLIHPRPLPTGAEALKWEWGSIHEGRAR